MGNQSGAFPFASCGRGVPADPNPNPRRTLCGKACGARCCLDERGSTTVDPGGAIFEDTIFHLSDFDQLAIRFAGSSNIGALRWLFLHGARLNTADSNGTSLLHVACRTGSLVVVQDLIRRGISTEVVDCAGWRPLHVSTCMDRKDITIYLLRAGADPSSENNWGQRPEDLCNSTSMKTVVSYDLHRHARAAPRPSLVPEDEFEEQLQSGVHFEPFFVPREPVTRDMSDPDLLERIGLQLFSKAPGRGLAFLVASGVVPDYPVNLNRFLIRHKADPVAYGEFLAADCPTSKTLCLEFLNAINFSGTGVVSALQLVFENVRPPRDWQGLDRLAKGISHFWWQQHQDEQKAGLGALSSSSSSYCARATSGGTPNWSLDREVVGAHLFKSIAGRAGLYRLMFSTLVLDHWFRQGHSLTIEEWTQLNTGLDDNGGDVAVHVQRCIYHLVAEEDFQLSKATAACHSSTASSASDDVSQSRAQPESRLFLSGIRRRPTPQLEGWVEVCYNGRGRVALDSMPSYWLKQPLTSLARRGGVLSAGRSLAHFEAALREDEPTSEAQSQGQSQHQHQQSKSQGQSQHQHQHQHQHPSQSWGAGLVMSHRGGRSHSHSHSRSQSGGGGGGEHESGRCRSKRSSALNDIVNTLKGSDDIDNEFEELSEWMDSQLGPPTEKIQDRVWLSLLPGVLLLGEAPSTCPFGVVFLTSVNVDHSDPASGTITLVGGAKPAESTRPNSGSNSNSNSNSSCPSPFVELSLLLPDGRFQVLEAPALDIVVPSNELAIWLRSLHSNSSVPNRCVKV